MKIVEVRKLAEKLRDMHGLHNWKITFGTNYSYGSGSIIASCIERDRVFEFNPKYFSINDEWFCRDQILHEIAHALAGYEAGHNKVWRDKCVEIGALPYELSERVHPSYNSPAPEFISKVKKYFYMDL